MSELDFGEDMFDSLGSTEFGGFGSSYGDFTKEHMSQAGTMLVPLWVAYRIDHREIRDIDWGDLAVRGIMGEGLYLYLDNDEYVKAKADREEMAVLKVEIDTSDCFDTTTFKGFNDLKNMLKNINPSGNAGFTCVQEAIKVYNKSGIIFNHSEGDIIILPMSHSISEYSGRKIVVYNSSIINDITVI